MKIKSLFILIACALFGVTGCNDMLELSPLDKVSGDQLLASQGGIKTLLARLYNSMPVEDFNYRPNEGFNRRGWNGVGAIIMTSHYTDESTQSQGTGAGPVTAEYWPYGNIREVNLFFENLQSALDGGVLTQDEYLRLKSEAHFIRAYMYFGLAKRYGGVPLIDEVQDHVYVPGSDNEVLYVPRSTEKETWEFILRECDLAVEHLPAVLTSEDGVYRASKWTAYGLKSRAALFAASVAKYWREAPLVGEAVDKRLVGMDPTDAQFFYNECLNASKAIIDQSGKTLYMPDPATREEAAKNFQNLFMTRNDEIIFSKSFLDGTTVSRQGHMYDILYNPAQTNPGYHKFGRFSPTLDIVDLFEDYTDDGTGSSAPVITRTDGNESYTVANPTALDVNLPFKKYSNLYEPFADKDARLLASVIVPGAVWKGVPIIIQGGLIQTDGSTIVYSDGSGTGLDGKPITATERKGLPTIPVSGAWGSRTMPITAARDSW